MVGVGRILPIIFYHYTEPLFEEKVGLGSLVPIGLTNHHGDLEDAKGCVAERNGLSF